jgi:hypothetical protein
MAYKRIIRVEANENESSDLLARVENAKKIVAIKTKNADVSDKDLLIFLLGLIESEQGEKGLTRGDQNLEKIQELIAKQMEVNATDKEAVTLNGKPVYVNKRRITSSFVQQTLGCSYNPIKAWFDNEANQAMLDKHHAKYGINESYNRLVSKALKQAAKE